MNELTAPAFAETMRLPDYPHLPGVNARHQDQTFREAKALLPSRTESATALENIPWLYGLRLFNAQFYWEAHEIWEDVWLRTHPNSREGHLLRSVIHLTNGALKGLLGRERARVRLAMLAIEECDAAFLRLNGRLMGLAESEIRAVAARLTAGSAVPSLTPLYAK